MYLEQQVINDNYHVTLNLFQGRKDYAIPKQVRNDKMTKKINQ